MQWLREFHYGYVIVFCCCMIMGVNVGLVMSSAGIFYRPVSEELGVSVGTFSVYMSFNFLFSTLALPLAGKMVLRFGARRTLSISSAILGVTLIAMSKFDAVWQFYIAGGISGVTLAFLLYLSFPTLVNQWFKVRVGFFMGVCSAASGIGGMLFNPVGAFVITNHGWRAAYALFGVIILVLVSPLLAWLIRDRPEDIGLRPFGQEHSAGKMAAASTDGIDHARAIRMPVFYGMIAFALLMISVSTLNLFIPNYVSGLGYSLEQAALTASAVMLGVTIGKVALGAINDRSSTAGVAVTITGGVAGLALLIAGQVGIIAVIAGGFLFGWAYAGVTVQTPMLVRAVFGSKDYTRIYSNVAVALAAGGALTSGGWGFLADAVPFRFVLGCGIAFLLFSGIIAMLALRAFSPDRLGDQPGTSF